MSYARFSDSSNVYVYPDVHGYVACCGCILGDKWDFHSPGEIVAHLREHVEAGHRVPADLLDENLYPPEDFIAMCDVYLCREQTGHETPHTPVRSFRDGLIRSRILTGGRPGEYTPSERARVAVFGLDKPEGTDAPTG